jgi:hypothetical protein
MKAVAWATCLIVFASLTVACVAPSPEGSDQAANSTGGITPSASTGSTPTSHFDYGSYLETLQKASGIKDPPNTEMIRLVPADQQAAVLKDCLAQAGFDVTISDGGVAPPSDIPRSQADAYQLAEYVCYAEYPADPDTFPPALNETEVETLYDYYVNELMPCLEAHGYDIPSPPPLEVFKDEFATGQNLWFPYDWVPAVSLSNKKWEEINRDCPQAPSDEVLYSDR